MGALSRLGLPFLSLLMTCMASPAMPQSTDPVVIDTCSAGQYRGVSPVFDMKIDFTNQSKVTVTQVDIVVYMIGGDGTVDSRYYPFTGTYAPGVHIKGQAVHSQSPIRMSKFVCKVGHVVFEDSTTWDGPRYRTHGPTVTPAP